MMRLLLTGGGCDAAEIYACLRTPGSLPDQDEATKLLAELFWWYHIKSKVSWSACQLSDAMRCADPLRSAEAS